MEIAGTALGVVALAGLFNTCLETLDILHSAATYGVRRERLAIKIEVEKIRLMIWGESVGISDLGDNPDEDDLEDVDDGLKRPRLRSAIMGLLVSFATILEDVESLGKEYGLAPDPSSGQTAHQLASAPDTLSSTFRKTYARFKSSSAAHQNAPGKTKARWAILDEKKFLVLVAELKAINDSLNSLLPTVQQKVRMQMRQEIMQSNSIEQLESLVTAADDVQDLLAETASLRLEMLTLNGGRRHESKVVQVEPEGSSLPTSTPAPNVPRPISMSIQRKPAPIQRPMSIQPGPASPSPAKPVVAAPPKPPYDDTGALLLHKIFMDKSLSIFSWLSGLDKSSESNPTPPLHPGFENYHVPENLLDITAKALRLEPEAHPLYAGLAPGTVSLHGFTREYNFWQGDEKSQGVKGWYKAWEVPPVTSGTIFDRWRALENGLPKDWTEKKGYEEIRALVGETTFEWLDGTEKYKLRWQIADLLSVLYRNTPPPSFASKASVGAVVHAPQMSPETDYGFVDVFLGLLLAREVMLRVDRNGGKWVGGGITDKICYDLIVSSLWHRNMELEKEDFQGRPEVRKRQIEALEFFVKEMEWPCSDELFATFNKLKGQKPSEMSIGIHTWDWISGLTLPGAFHGLAIMSTLYECSPTLAPRVPRVIVKLREGNWGILFKEKSYWAQRSALARVLAPLPGIKELGGLVGPCPPIVIADSEFGKIIEVKARPAPFLLQDPSKGATSSTDPKNIYIPKPSSDWDLPFPPPPPTSTATLTSITLTPLGAHPEGPTWAPLHQARLTFTLTPTLTLSKTLYTNSLFIDIPPCHGTHRIPRSSKEAYKRRVLELEELENAQLEGGVGVTVVNAGVGGEVLARAWCCHVGTNAGVWRRGGTCFRCALMVVGEGTGVGVLIVC